MPTQQLQLRDIHLPESIGWWPPAMGWWILAFLLPLLGFLMFWLYKRISRKTAIKTAKKLLSKIKQDSSSNNMDKLIALSELLRRVAISIYPRKQVASLTGQAWLDFLDSSVIGAPYSKTPGTLLAHGHYQKSAPTDIEIMQLIKICENWLNSQKYHKK